MYNKDFHLYMVLLGCKPPGRNTEQHDVFFGIAESLHDLMPEMKAFWKEAEGKLHIDAWREVNVVDGHRIEVSESDSETMLAGDQKLFFINLGGYKPDDFEEYHYKVLSVAPAMSDAVKGSKQTAFYKHTGFEDGGVSHVDDKYGIDIDDVAEIGDVLRKQDKDRFSIRISKSSDAPDDKLHIGYVSFKKLEQLKN